MKSVIINVGMMFLARLTTRGAQAITFVILARVLTPEDFGTYGVLTSLVFLIGQIGPLGLRQAGAFSIGKEQATGGEVLGTFLLLWPFLATAVIGCAYFLGGTNAAETSTQQLAIYLAAAAVLFISLSQAFFLGHGLTKYYASTDTAPRLFLLLLTVLTAVSGVLNLERSLIIFSASFLLASIYVACIVSKALPWSNFRISIGKIPGMIKLGLLYAISSTAILLQGRIGLFFLADTDHQLAGQFFAAQRASEIFLEVATATGLVLFSETIRSKDKKLAMKGALKAAFFLFVAFLCIGLVSANFIESLVPLLLGDKYQDAASALTVLLIGLGPAAAIRILNSAVSGLGMPYISAAIVLSGIIVNFIFCYFLIPQNGLDGAATALVIGQFFSGAVYIVTCYYLYNFSIDKKKDNA